jgi:3-oxoacyl-[acyl-carrier-protein] synthase II
VVEDLEHARTRRAPIYAEILGVGRSCDAYHITAPRPDGSGAAAAIRAALDDARLDPERVGYVNAHGTSTPLNDRAEALAIRAVLGANVPVSSTKSVTGHLLGAAGAVEAVACIQALRGGLLPPTANLDDPDPDCALDHVRGGARESEIAYAISNSFGFGGHNVTLVFGHTAQL